MNWPIISDDLVVQFAYEDMRARGESHMLAEMLATRSAPMVRTDNTFLTGHCNGNQFEKMPQIGDYYKSVAEKAGVNIQGAVYKSGLAQFPGDPRAWIRSRGDVQKVCEERGMGCSGDVTVKRRDEEPEPDIDVADDVVEQRVMDKIDANPDLAYADQTELHEATKEEVLPDYRPEPVL